MRQQQALSAFDAETWQRANAAYLPRVNAAMDSLIGVPAFAEGKWRDAYNRAATDLDAFYDARDVLREPLARKVERVWEQGRRVTTFNDRMRQHLPRAGGIGAGLLASGLAGGLIYRGLGD